MAIVPEIVAGLDSETDAVSRVQFRTMLRTSWLFLPVTMINAVIMAVACFDVASWQAALTVPTFILLSCYSQLWDYSRLELDLITIDGMQRVVARQARSAIAIALAIATWGLWLGASGPSEFSYVVALLAGFTTIATVAYVAYIEHAVRAVLVTVSLAMFAMFAYRGDFAGMLAAALYSTSAFILQHHLTSHLDKLLSVVRSELEAQALFEDAKKAETASSHLANTDFLTGVANRRAFLMNAEALCLERADSKVPFALGLIDLDDFKPVNDGYGHAAGDAVLVEIAKRLQNLMGEHGLVARLGGDEFAILVPEPMPNGALKMLGDRIIAELGAPVYFGQFQLQVSASCGLAVFPEAGTATDRLLEHADEALYHVKTTTRGTTAIFDIRCQHETMRLAATEQRLRRAIDADLIDLHFQPIHCAKTGHVRGYEALARWTDAQAGVISPAEFIPIAERCGLINKLSQRLLTKAVREATRWPACVKLSFNLSAAQFSDENLAINILATLSSEGLAPDRLVLEITETAILGNPEQAGDVLRMLRSLGIGIALDDFGTGYSSLSYLHRFPVDVLKLDRSFISDLTQDLRRQEIVKTIIDLCKRLHLVCVAEGIEDAEQQRLATALGFDVLQGYYLGRPVAADCLSHEAIAPLGRVA